MKKFYLTLLFILSINLNALENVEDDYKYIADMAVNEELCQMGFISFYKHEYAKSEKFLSKCLQVKETTQEEKQKAKFYLIWQVYKGKVLNYDKTTIAQYLYDLSKIGSSQAQYLGGLMHFYGTGVEKDYRKSALYFRNASQSIFFNMMFPDNLQMLRKPMQLNGVKSYNKIFDMKYTINDETQIFNNLNLAFELRTMNKSILKDYSFYIKENMIDMFKNYPYSKLVKKNSKDIVKKDIKEYLNEKFRSLDFPSNIIDEIVITKFYFDI